MSQTTSAILVCDLVTQQSKRTDYWHLPGKDKD